MVGRLAIVAPLLIFTAALPVPALAIVGTATGETKELWFGWMALSVGWSGVLVGCVGWFANPGLALGLSLAHAKKTVAARTVLTIAWMLGVSTIVQVFVPFVGDEGGVTHSVLQPKVGCFLWLASLTMAAIIAWIPVHDQRPCNPQR